MFKRKSIFIVLSIFVLLGFAGTMAFAYEKGDKNILESNDIPKKVQEDAIFPEEKDNIKAKDAPAEGNKNQDTLRFPEYGRNFKDMMDWMEQYGHHDMARYMEENDYEAMRDYMSNLSEEDFNTMMQMMEQRGHHFMANRMQIMGRDGRTYMHKNPGYCHGPNGFRGRATGGRNFRR